MKVQKYRFTGLSPLLMANIQSVNRDLPQLKLGTKPNKGDIEKIAEGMSYRNDDGELYVPSVALRSSLLSGCTGIKFPGSRTGPKKIFSGLVFPAEECAVLRNKRGKPIKNFEVQIDSGVNGTNRIIIVRPRISERYIELPVEIDDEFAPGNYDEFLEVLLTIWNRAGRMAGVGAWRPEKQGRHGKYMVEEI